jgi:glutamate decarboxylase
VAQYYNFLRLGKSGYRDIMENMLHNCKHLANKLEKSGKFEIINKDILFPLVAVRLKDAEFTVFQLSEKLREKGWIIPAYTLPENAQDVAVLRMVIKENFGRDMVDSLLDDVMEAYAYLEKQETKNHKKRENTTLLY